MIKILHIIPSLGVGGTEKMLLELCRGLDKTRFENSVIALKSGGATAQALTREGVAFRVLNSPDSFLPGLLDMFPLHVRLKNVIRKISPDVIHTWLTRANVAGRCAARSAGNFPVISSLRVIEKEKAYHLWAEKWTQAKADAVTVNCTPMRDFAVQDIGIPQEKIKVIFNGIRAASPQQSSSTGKPDGLRFGAMGRLHAQKGFDIFLEAAKLVLQKNPDCRFTIAGEGPERSSLENLARRLGIKEKVKFAGVIKSADFFGACDIFVLSSRWEGMPNVVMEAMAYGKSIAASRVGGVTDLIEDGKEGLLFPPESPQACAQAMLRLAESPDLRSKLASAAQKKIKEKFSMETMVKQYEELYGQVLQRR